MMKLIEFLYLFMKYPLVQPAVTPRFAVSCSMDLMKKMGDLAQKYNVNIQVFSIR